MPAKHRTPQPATSPPLRVPHNLPRSPQRWRQPDTSASRAPPQRVSGPPSTFRLRHTRAAALCGVPLAGRPIGVNTVRPPVTNETKRGGPIRWRRLLHIDLTRAAALCGVPLAGRPIGINTVGHPIADDTKRGRHGLRRRHQEGDEGRPEPHGLRPCPHDCSSFSVRDCLSLTPAPSLTSSSGTRSYGREEANSL